MFEHPPTLRLVVVSGGFGMQSKTETLVQTIADEIAKRLSVELEFVKFSEIGGFIGQTFDRKQLPEHVQIALHTVETADALIVGTPVYRASYPGLFKHFFDLIEQFVFWVNVPSFSCRRIEPVFPASIAATMTCLPEARARAISAMSSARPRPAPRWSARTWTESSTVWR